MIDTLLFYRDSIFSLTVQKINDQSQQFLEFIMDQCRGFHNLLVVQFLGQNTCGHIRNAGNAHHIHTIS